MKCFKVMIEGITPLMHHKMRDEDLHGLRASKGAKKKDKVDIDLRTLAESYSYRNPNGTFYIPAGYISGAFAHVSSDYKQTNSTRRSYKSVAGGIFRLLEQKPVMLTKNNKPITTFEVDFRWANNFKAGKVPVARPLFEDWRIAFTVAIDESIISPEVAHQILEDAGRRAGIGSFRVSKSGHFGQFSVISWREMKEENRKSVA